MRLGRRRGNAEQDPSLQSTVASVPPSEDEERGGVRRRGARLRQQELPSHVVTFASRHILSLYFAAALLFIPFGAAVLAASLKVKRTDVISYASRAECDVGKIATEGRLCTVPFKVEERIPAPSYLYYALTEFHQNTRKYARSQSDQQLRGMVPKSLMFVSNCEPYLYKENSTHGQNGFRPEEFYLPCGLTARSRFNDTFEVCRDSPIAGDETEACQRPVPLRKDGIAWKSDREKKFRPGNPPLYTTKINELLQNEDFIVWMRLSTFKNFHKLYRIIETDLEPGTYYMRINSRYPVASFHGDKRFFITTITWFGESNRFLGILLLVSGNLALLIAVCVLARDVIKPRPPIAQNPDELLVALARLNCEFSESISPRQS
jgi:LEM3 (ligand-effect modulator 3) family / CDC50 family